MRRSTFGVLLVLVVSLLSHGGGREGEIRLRDSLDAFAVHGIGGTVGAILTGVFASSAVNAIYKDSQGNPLPSGLIDGHGG